MQIKKKNSRKWQNVEYVWEISADENFFRQSILPIR